MREAKQRTVLTCVYCGHEYPDGTPAAKHKLLTDHIAVCDKHPMKAVIAQRNAAMELLQRALEEPVLAETTRGSFYYCSEAAEWQRDVREFLQENEAANVP